ncbi:MAG: hypothetical protein AB7O57_14240 [Hyphomicrobiaceae bacterium]
MRARTTKRLASWFRDMAIGAAIVLVLPLLGLGLQAPNRSWAIDAAAAGEVLATRAVEVTAPPGPAAENAIVAVAQLRPAGVSLQARRNTELVVLWLSFSALVAFNLAFWRHLRRVSGSPRRDERRQRL